MTIRMSVQDVRSLERLAERYGVEALLAALRRPGKRGRPSDHGNNMHHAWMCVELRRDRSPGLRPLSARQASEMLAADMQRYTLEAPSAETLRSLHGRSAKIQKADTKAASMWTMELRKLRTAVEECGPEAKAVPLLLKPEENGAFRGGIVDRDKLLPKYKSIWFTNSALIFSQLPVAEK